MTQQACIIQQLSLDIHSKNIFDQLHFNLPIQQCTGLIGRNGQGKSLLMQCLAQVSKFSFIGQIHWQCPVAYLSQFNRLRGNTIAQVLDIEDLVDAFKRIENNTASFQDYDLVEDKWHLPYEWQQQLEQAGLPLDLNFSVHLLSEGQKTKLALCRVFALKDHYVLLDEPSNHLDCVSRKWLISCLKAHTMGSLIISHDRLLLDEMQHILEFNEFGISHFSGNYTHYAKQSALQRHALEQDIEQEKRQLKQQVVQQHQILMKNQKRQASANKKRKTGSQAKVILDFKREQATQQSGQLIRQQQRQLHQEQLSLCNKKQRLETVKSQQFEFSSAVQKSGEILRLANTPHPYLQNAHFNFSLQSKEKIHLVGENGSGKSTLLRILSRDSSNENHDSLSLSRSLYLDQNFSFLDQRLSALENLMDLNPDQTAEFWRNLLGQLRLRGDKVLQPLSELSGGEQLKVALIAMAHPLNSIDLLLLDEPENHLDIESRELLAKSIQSFNGAIILVSHDDYFVKQCGIIHEVKIAALLNERRAS